MIDTRRVARRERRIFFICGLVVCCDKNTKYIPASVVVGCEKSRAVWRLLILYWIQLY